MVYLRIRKNSHYLLYSLMFKIYVNYIIKTSNKLNIIIFADVVITTLNGTKVLLSLTIDIINSVIKEIIINYLDINWTSSCGTGNMHPFGVYFFEVT